MSRKRIDMVGRKISRLTFLSFSHQEGVIRYWHTICDCGNKKIADGASARSGKTLSCGCLRKKNRYKHGRNGSKIYRIWYNMKTRCLNPNDANWIHYGGRWATASEQQNNKTNNRKITYQGITHTITEWATILDINIGTLDSRFRRDWSVERAFTEKVHNNRGLKI